VWPGPPHPQPVRQDRRRDELVLRYLRVQLVVRCLRPGHLLRGHAHRASSRSLAARRSTDSCGALTRQDAPCRTAPGCSPSPSSCPSTISAAQALAAFSSASGRTLQCLQAADNEHTQTTDLSRGSAKRRSTRTGHCDSHLLLSFAAVGSRDGLCLLTRLRLGRLRKHHALE